MVGGGRRRRGQLARSRAVLALTAGRHRVLWGLRWLLVGLRRGLRVIRVRRGRGVLARSGHGGLAARGLLLTGGGLVRLLQVTLRGAAGGLRIAG